VTPILQRLLALLADGAPHTATQLCTALAISPSQLDETIRTLKNDGVTITGTTQYQIVGGLSLLDKSCIYANLSPVVREQLNHFELANCLPSTNSYLLENTWLTKGLSLCLAEHQTAGRGRHGRQWLSPYASGLCLSVKYTYSSFKQSVVGLNLAIAVATVDALRQLGADTVGIKWPNDIWWQRKKLAGLLLETRRTAQSQTVVIGIGLNVNDTPAEVSQDSIDLYTILGRHIARNMIAAHLINHWTMVLLNYPSQGFEPYQASWQAYDLLQGQPIQVHTGTDIVTGIATGIDQTGALLVQVGSQQQRYVHGEVSIRL
jgi:BirA family biotin operon repressor/biotin-[acetyl-CoA-carboxylase] ligase